MGFINSIDLFNFLKVNNSFLERNQIRNDYNITISGLYLVDLKKKELFQDCLMYSSNLEFLNEQF